MGWDLIETNGHPLVIENLELAVFSTLVQGSSYNNLEPPIIKVSEISIARVREAAEYIRANIKKELTIAQVAAAMNCSSRSLQTAFARHYGVSPSQFLRTARLEAARTVPDNVPRLPEGCPVEVGLAGQVNTVAGIEALARRGELYFNLHTEEHSFYGEMRGQIYPAKA